MTQDYSDDKNVIVRRLNVPLTQSESDQLKKLAKLEQRSEGKMAQILLQDGLRRAQEDGKI